MAEAATIQPLAPAPNDFRYRWLSETISKLLGISDRKFVDDLLSDNNENIRSFFDDAINDFTDCNKRLLFTWRTFYDKLVEETISILEEGEKNRTTCIPKIQNCTIYSSNNVFIAVAPATPPPEAIKKKTKGKGRNRLNTHSIEII